MRYDQARDSLRLSTGREVTCRDGIVGLDISGALECELCCGSEGHIETQQFLRDIYPEAELPDVLHRGITDAEACEIADYMISAWQAYRNSFKQEL